MRLFRGLALIFALTLASCSKSAPLPDSDAPAKRVAAEQSEIRVGSLVLPKRNDGCPPSFKTPVSRCSLPSDPCDYPEGRCQCLTPPPCGGAALPPAPGVWRCSHKSSPLDKDGCPKLEPTSGTPCQVEETTCRYGFGCGAVITQCRRGRWHTQIYYPPYP